MLKPEQLVVFQRLTSSNAKLDMPSGNRENVPAKGRNESRTNGLREFQKGLSEIDNRLQRRRKRRVKILSPVSRNLFPSLDFRNGLVSLQSHSGSKIGSSQPAQRLEFGRMDLRCLLVEQNCVFRLIMFLVHAR